MKVVTPKQMNQIDKICIDHFGIPGVVLMENAALIVVEEIITFLGNVSGKRVLVIAGKGNNGGDAFAVSRHLYNKGALVSLFITASKNDITGDGAINLSIAEKSGIEPIEVVKEQSIDKIKTEMEKADLIVDGMLGTGLKGEITGILAEIIRLVNCSGVPVFSIDIPSGINGETGKVMGTCIKATRTISFGLPKVGLLVHPGCEFTGQLIIADIGIPQKAINSINIKLNTIQDSYVSQVLPVRLPDTHKGSYGKIFIIGGSLGMTGAGYLAAAGALRVGGGLVCLGIPSTLVCKSYPGILEVISIPLEDRKSGYLSKDSISVILGQMKTMTVTAIGPGLSTREDVHEVVFSVIENSDIPLIIDADGLNVLACDIDVLKKLRVPAVITPHPGEMARLAGISIREVQNNRIEIAQEFASNWKVITVLKGAKTIVALPGGEIYINPTGNSGMATAGSGDVLTGVISGLIGQGMRPEEAAISGVYLHGLAGDRVAEVKGVYGLNARDIVEELPYTIKKAANVI